MLIRKMANVLLVGSGMTGAAVAALLRQDFSDRLNVSIWDKARGAGGRMSTSRCQDDGSLTVDLGAQYITLTKEYKTKRESLYDELLSQGILSPLRGQIEGPNNFDQPGAQHFVTPLGISSLVKHFLQKAYAEVKYQHHVSEVNFDVDSKVSVITHDDIAEDFDVLILTVPVPQILQLKGSLHDCIGNLPDVKKRLQNVSYSSRYALGLFFPPKTDLNVSWCAKYFSENPCIRYISIDQAKRGVENLSLGSSLAVHTSVPFGLAHLEEDLISVQAEILTHVKTILPQLPEPSSLKPQKWRYSQVHHAYQGSPGCVTVSTNPLVILAGDGFSTSTFDGCLDSAEAVLRTLKENLKLQPDSVL